VAEAVESYSVYVNDQAEEMAALTREFTDAVRAGDLAAAQEAYAPSREPWERIEPIAGLVEELDGRMDARVDDFAGVDDPQFTGWHRLEYLLFEEDTTKGATKFADQLDEDVATLQRELSSLEIPAAAVPVGASELIEEVSLGKITGEEDRYSKTDLWDLNANVEGSEQAIAYLSPALEEADPDLGAEIDDALAEVKSTLEPLRDGDGWQLYCVPDDEYPSDRCDGEPTIDAETIDQLKAQTANLSELTSQVAGALGLSEG
jgi:iron uptake system component EfeO